MELDLDMVNSITVMEAFIEEIGRMKFHTAKEF